MIILYDCNKLNEKLISYLQIYINITPPSNPGLQVAAWRWLSNLSLVYVYISYLTDAR